MLVLSRKLGERIILVDNVTKAVLATVIIVEADRNRARIGLTAEPNISIYREEILPMEYYNRGQTQPGDGQHSEGTGVSHSPPPPRKGKDIR